MSVVVTEFRGIGGPNGFAMVGALGPMNNAETLVPGLRAIAALGFNEVNALRSPAAAGYVVLATTSLIEVDRPVDLRDCVCDPHKLTMVMADGSIESRYLLANCGPTAIGTAPGPQFLDSDVYPNTGPQPDSFTVAIDLGPAVPVGVTSNTDGSVQLHYDMTPLGLGIGTHSASVTAISALWGNSAPVTSSFVVAAAVTTLLEVEVPFSTTPPVGARWILTDGVEVGAGHVVAGSVSSVTLDHSVELDICGSYTLTTFAPDGTGVEAQDTITDCGDQTIVALETNLAQAPSAGWIWTLRDAPIGWEDVVVPITGVQSICMSSAVGVDISEPVQVPVFGTAIFGNVGTVSVIVHQFVSVTGLSSTGAVGEITYRQDQFVEVTGASATGEAGSVDVILSVDVAATGLSATASVGTVAVVIEISVSVTGLSAAGEAGAVGVEADGSFPVFGTPMDGQLGGVFIEGQAVVSVVGVVATAGVGTVSVESAISVDALGMEGICGLGTAEVIVDQATEILGVSSAAFAGAAVADENQDIYVVGVQATGVLGRAVARVSTERHRVLRVAPTRSPRVLRVSISSDGLPFTRT